MYKGKEEESIVTAFSYITSLPLVNRLHRKSGPLSPCLLQFPASIKERGNGTSSRAILCFKVYRKS